MHKLFNEPPKRNKGLSGTNRAFPDVDPGVRLLIGFDLLGAK